MGKGVKSLQRVEKQSQRQGGVKAEAPLNGFAVGEHVLVMAEH